MIEAKSVSFKYSQNGSKTLNINNLNLQIKKGEIISLLGKSGSGKSTIAAILAGLRNDMISGEVLCNNQRLIQPESSVALVLQSYRDTVFPWFNVKRNIEIGFYKNNSQEKSDAVIREIANSLNINDKLLSNPTELSGGQAQRIQIARALAANCNFLILDEPSSSLDMEFREFLLKLLITLKNNKKGILLVTHNIEEAVYISDRILLCKKNELTNNVGLEEFQGYGHKEENLGKAQKDPNYQTRYACVYEKLFPR